MRQIVRLALVGIVTLGLATAACAGNSKPPMVPDSPDPALGDAGAEMPSSAPATKK
jgi:hypothetical protein